MRPRCCRLPGFMICGICKTTSAAHAESACAERLRAWLNETSNEARTCLIQAMAVGLTLIVQLQTGVDALRVLPTYGGNASTSANAGARCQ